MRTVPVPVKKVSICDGEEKDARLAKVQDFQTHMGSETKNSTAQVFIMGRYRSVISLLLMEISINRKFHSFAPAARSTFTHNASPNCNAQYNDVLPCLSFAFTFAFADNNSFTTDTEP